MNETIVVGVRAQLVHVDVELDRASGHRGTARPAVVAGERATPCDGQLEDRRRLAPPGRLRQDVRSICRGALTCMCRLTTRSTCELRTVGEMVASSMYCRMQ